MHVNFGGPSNAPGGNGRPRPFVFDVWRFQRELLGAEVVSLVLYVRVCLSSCSPLVHVHMPSHQQTRTPQADALLLAACRRSSYHAHPLHKVLTDYFRCRGLYALIPDLTLI